MVIKKRNDSRKIQPKSMAVMNEKDFLNKKFHSKGEKLR